MAEDKRAPMAAAPMVYREDGSADWGNMWTSYCALAQEGGPPHRGTLLPAPADADPTSSQYQAVVAELTRGIKEVSDLDAAPDAPGWLAVRCPSPAMALWLADAVKEENVEARHMDAKLLVPVGADFQLTGEIKNIITVVGKTTHYWHEHLAPEVKQTLAWQTLAQDVLRWLQARLGVNTT